MHFILYLHDILTRCSCTMQNPFLNIRFDVICCVHASKKDITNNEGMLYRLFKYLYAPILVYKFLFSEIVHSRPLITYFCHFCTIDKWS